MRLSRREFFKLVGGLGAASLVSFTKVQEALAGHGDPRVIWLQGQSCSGCSVSLLNSIYYTTADDLLLNTINLEYHSTLIAAAGDLAWEGVKLHPNIHELKHFQSQWLKTGENLDFDLNNDREVNLLDYAKLCNQGFILVVEGPIPIEANGHYCDVGGKTMLEAFQILGRDADHIIAVGCGCYGGIPAAAPNPTGALGAADALQHLGISKPVVNIPGCPVHPDWIVGTLAYLLANGNPPPLDAQNRPADYYGDDNNQKIHPNCPRRGNQNPRAQYLGESGCLEDLGCKGKYTFSDCPLRKWNSPAKDTYGVNWCIGSNNVCIGCVQPDFPDGMTPFYTLDNE